MVAIVFVAVYSAAGVLAERRTPYDLQTRVDRMIPFLPWTAFVYISAFPGAFLPLFVVRCRRLLIRSAWAHVSVIVCSGIVFVLFPVHAVGLRTDAGILSPARFADWLIGLIHSTDTVANLFPSLHVSLATLTGATLWRADRRHSLVLITGVLLLLVSTWTTKQHYIVDGIGGLAAGLCAAWLAFRSYRPASTQSPLLSPSAIGSYAIFHVGFLMVLYALFLA